MKSSYFVLLLALLGVVFSACSPDVGDSCDLKTFGYECEGELLLTCASSSEDVTLGVIVSTAGYCRDGKPVYTEPNTIDETKDPVLSCSSEFRCQGNQLERCSGKEEYASVKENYDCEKGKDGISAEVVFCENGELQYSSLYCSEEEMVVCQTSGAKVVAQKRKCPKGVCTEFERNGTVSYACSEPVEDAGCGTITNEGECGDDNVLTFCSKKTDGKLLRLNCGELGMTCEKVNDTYGYDCVIKCGDNNEFNDFGSCTNNVLNYCDASGKLVTLDCTTESLTCDFGGYEKNYYDCFERD